MRSRGSSTIVGLPEIALLGQLCEARRERPRAAAARAAALTDGGAGGDLRAEGDEDLVLDRFDPLLGAQDLRPRSP